MVYQILILLANKQTDNQMDTQSKGHKKTRSVSPLFLRTGDIQNIRHTLNFPSSNTLRNNPFTNHLEDKANQRYTLANDPSKQIKAAFFKNKVQGKIYSVNRSPLFNSEPENIKITFTYDRIPSQNKLKQFLQPFPSNKLSKSPEQNETVVEKKNESHSLNTAQKRAPNPQMVSTKQNFFKSYQKPYYKLNSEKRKDISKYKQKPKGYKEMRNKKNILGQPEKKVKQLTKINNTIQTLEILKKSDSNVQQNQINKEFEGLLGLQNNNILVLEQKIQLLTKKNKKLQQENVLLKNELKVYSQMKSQQPLKLSSQQSQQEIISNQKELQAILKLISKNLENKESQLHVLTEKNKQLQAVIANWKVDQERYSSAFRKEYVQLMDRLKERESVIQQLQTSNNILREQYAQLHINIQRITKEKEKYLHQELEQWSFTSQQNRLFIASSIR